MTARREDPQARIRHFHAIYCNATGIQLRLGICDAGRERCWCDYLAAGFTEVDLLIVANYLKREILKGTRNPGALKFSNMIAQLDRFEEDLQFAKATARNAKPPPTPLRRVLEQARPTATTMTPKDAQTTAKPVSFYIDQLRKAAQ